ncbi:2-oxoacid:ferredoxin oxidoreductase subunit beta [Tessaracoccus flavus]|jgi:2-oxoglutarate ferredoxin oxidoreductase subunit beta|uniref:2-oxoacid:ferredoxin oxidoreductase subunit beta n=1 Tax=Tessaracoccus flavus TaxID=1610493 RepID=A0A1Q2CCN6_9ACTN|nr:2-oxoacid:ferredoxin oxidoreductase subunit beta [Tessaracoccus flavus]AQP43861.1 2-oxoacid:ferredoxin oxidoreductase subunit beta [Tessaracoccus flavus]SDY26563.1 2-oxoglutarate ferredoxin oxidoreductase subunit beta [Tessaracoccus flavus]
MTQGLAGVPLSLEPLTKKDYTSDQEVRWCPGCGDYAVLATFQSMMATLGIKRENTVIISGIGCSSRFPYYVDTYGMHSIHGRAPSIATGVAISRPDLNVWVVTGDGDALSIGGNHLMHTLRRNVNVTIMLFNNRIYGLTKGQYSPTSELGKVTKSTPYGSLDTPFNPVSLALGAEATFVARTIDSDRKHLAEVLTAAAEHRGASLVEIYQNCPIFNDDAFATLKGPDGVLISLRHGEPIVFGGGEYCVIRDAQGEIRVAPTADVDPSHIVVHDETRTDPSQAFALSRLTEPGVLRQAPIGIFRRVERPTYDDLVRDQIAAVKADDTEAALKSVIAGSATWEAHERPA